MNFMQHYQSFVSLRQRFINEKRLENKKVYKCVFKIKKNVNKRFTTSPDKSHAGALRPTLTN